VLEFLLAAAELGHSGSVATVNFDGNIQMRLSVISCGHLGAVHAACMAEIGHDVLGVDIDVRWEEAPLGPEAIRLIRRLRERGYAGRTCRDYGHAVVHLGRYLHEELESDRGRDEGVVADFLAGHLPGCRCYRRPAGRREEPARRGLAHLLVMLREEGAFPRSRRSSRPTAS